VSGRPEQPLGTSSRRDRLTAWALVAGQFTLLGLVVLLPAGHTWSLPPAVALGCRVAAVAGLVVMVVAATALGRGLTAAPLPNQHARLRTGGLYRYVRHPIYSGLLLFALAQSLTSGSPWVGLSYVLLVLLIGVKARWEERHLAARFPDYPEYARRTPRFVPGLVRH
jgi:protein-S-isoprenylcysteine O-methyltransferase Ste14